MGDRHVVIIRVLLCCCIATFGLWMFTLNVYLRYRNGSNMKAFAPMGSTSSENLFDESDGIQGRNEERKRRIQRVCGQKECLDPRRLDGLIVNDKFKVMYCYVPKVACTQWKTYFAALDGTFLKPGVPPDRIHYMPKGTFKFLSSYPLAERSKILRTYYKFLFVREPMERLLSAYKDKFSEKSKDPRFKKNWSKYVVKFMKNENTSRTDFNITFRDFLGFVGSDQVVWQEHWNLVYKLCQPCAVDYDFIGHFEDLEEEAPYVIKASRMNESVPFATYRRSKTTDGMLQAYSRIPPNVIIKAAGRYKSDFELFGYPFPGRLNELLGPSYQAV